MMKDKVKGLFLGLLIGVFLTGSLAYAANSTQIQVVFKKLKFMVEGIEYKAKDNVFIYNNKTYVPVSLLGDVLGKKVAWDGEASTVWIGSKGGKEVVAAYGNVKVTKEQLTLYLSIIRYFNPQYQQYEQDANYQEFMLKRMIGYKLLASKADELTKKRMKDKTVEELDKVKLQINSTEGSPYAFETKLNELKIKEIDVYNYLLHILTAIDITEKQIGEEPIMAEYDTTIKADANAYTSATVSHILIGLNDQAGTVLRTKEEAFVRAIEVQTKLKDGGDFAALAKEYSDDPGSKDTGGSYPSTPVSNWVPGFKEATIELPLGTISEPVETTFGYHIMKVTERTIKTMDIAKAEIRSRLAQMKLGEYFEVELPGLIKDINLSSLAPSPTATPAP
ncbi:MAG TPA: peptidylprolyl isomerase [Bacilli bacterium]